MGTVQAGAESGGLVMGGCGGYTSFQHQPLKYCPGSTLCVWCGGVDCQPAQKQHDYDATLIKTQFKNKSDHGEVAC